MPEVGPLEILLVAVVALIVFGPEKLPEIARNVGKFLADLRRVVDEAKGEFQAGLALDEDLDDHPMSEAISELPDILDGPLHPGDVETTTDPAAAPESSTTETSGPPAGTLTPIPMTLDHGSAGEEPDNV